MPLHVPLILLMPFLVFVKHHGYELARPEFVACAAGLGAVGLVFALPARISSLLNVLISAVLVSLFVDFQTHWFTGWDWSFSLTIVGFAACFWIVRKHLSTIATTIFAVMFVATLFAPAAPSWQERIVEVHDDSRSADLPILLHIVLDEQIGIEGIPRNMDPDGYAADQLRSFYVASGFELFGRAFSRYYDTHFSLANLLNFDASNDPAKYFPDGFAEGTSLESNAYFDELARRGYSLRIYQTDYMDFCSHPESRRVAGCLTYELETLQAVRDSSLMVREKVRLIATMYTRLSAVLSDLRTRYAGLRARMLADGWNVPDWDTVEGHVSSLAVPSIIERIRQDVAHAQRGEAYFAHLMLPHYPFVYDADCRIRRSVDEWPAGWDGIAYPKRNFDGSRVLKYPRYLEQALCAMKLLRSVFEALDELPAGRDALVIVHGDHGSRLNTTYPMVEYAQNLSASDIVDSYSTLFAVRDRRRVGAYRRDVVPLQELLRRSLHGERTASQGDPPTEPYVYLTNKGQQMQRRPLVPFAEGRPTPQW